MTEKKEQPKEEGIPSELGGQPCPVCGQNTLTLRESTRDVPFFGEIMLYSMACSNCGFFKSDIETENAGNPVKIVYEINSEEDMKTRVIKSSSATIKIPRITTIDPGNSSVGYVSNIEGLFNRVKRQIEKIRDDSDDKAERNKAKNLLKKIRKIMWGEESIKITIIDPNGNSAIVSEKAIVSKK